MSLTPMVERVAKAIADAFMEDYEEATNLYDEMARAAIGAMREPTDAMTEAGWPHTADPCWQDDVGHAWRAMIDAALAPSPAAQTKE